MGIGLESVERLELLLILIVGRSQQGKTTLADGIVTNLGLSPIRVFLADRKTKRNFYRGASWGRMGTLLKPELSIEKYQNAHLDETIIIEDITGVLKVNPILAETLGHLLTKRRTNTILITQNMRGMESFVREVRFVVFFETGDLTNLKTILRGGNFPLLDEQIRNLKKGQYIVVDTVLQKYNGPFDNHEIEPLVSAFEKGVNGFSYRKVVREDVKVEKPMHKKYELWRLLLNDQTLTFSEIAKKLGNTANSCRVMAKELRSEGLIPNTMKGTWTVEQIEECKEKAMRVRKWEKAELKLCLLN